MISRDRGGTLRRLEIWPRNIVTQHRLKSVAVCEIDRDSLDTIGLRMDFARRSKVREMRLDVTNSRLN